MSTLLVWKEQLQLFYGKYAAYVDKVLRLILGILVFGLINSNIGYMKMASSVFVTAGLAVICAFLPFFIMTLLATVLILLHFYALSLPVLFVTALIFLIMYIFYFRFTPGKAWLVLLTPVAFALKVPYIIPIAFGLLGTPVYVVPIAFGTVVYYMLHYVKMSSAALKSSGAEGLVNSLTSYSKQVLQNKEMLVMILAFAICLILVYNIRTKSVDHAWKIAVAVGVIANIVVVIVGNVVLNVHTSYGSLIVGNLIAALIGICLEFIVFSVDYSRTQRIQFEDDEYYYYVKAVPKIAVSAPEKTVKKINERQDTEAISRQEVRKAAEKPRASKKRNAASQEEWTQSRTEEELLKQSLNKELGIEHKQNH